MVKVLTFVIGLVILFSLIIGATYYFYERPLNEESQISQFHNVSIRFIDSNTNNEIKANYSVILQPGNRNYLTGEYIGVGFDRKQIPVNNSFDIFNTYTDECYYSSKFHQEFTTISTNIRAEIPLDLCGSVNFTQFGTLIYEEDISLNLNIQGIIKNPTLCLQWSENFLTVKLENMTSSEVPDRLSTKVVKCYLLNESIKDDQHRVEIEYDTIRPLGLKDFIKVYLVDDDFPQNKTHDRFIKDIIYQVN